MRILVLGGTKFLGRHTVLAALAAGHEVTVFNRGRTAPGLFPDVRQLRGDRETGDVAALAGGEWDGAVDFSGMLPGQIEAVARLLTDRVGHYTFMSTIGVYAPLPGPGATETAALLPWTIGTPEVWSMADYGAFKVGCEQAVTAAFPGRSTLVRSGLVVGPDGYDLGRWGQQLATGADIACSLRPEQPIQVLDSRDLAAFLLHTTLSGVDGPLNVVGPAAPLTVAGLAGAWVAAVPGARVHWRADGDSFGVSTDLAQDATFQLSTARARAAGLRLRPLEQTAGDCIEWIRRGGRPLPPPH